MKQKFRIDLLLEIIFERKNFVIAYFSSKQCITFFLELINEKHTLSNTHFSSSLKVSSAT
jgi:hypothetical protein